MQIFEDVKVEGKYIVVFTFEEYSKIVVESTRTTHLIIDVVKDVLQSGIEHYPYTTKKNARY